MSLYWVLIAIGESFVDSLLQFYFISFFLYSQLGYEDDANDDDNLTCKLEFCLYINPCTAGPVKVLYFAILV